MNNRKAIQIFRDWVKTHPNAVDKRYSIEGKMYSAFDLLYELKNDTPFSRTFVTLLIQGKVDGIKLRDIKPPN